LLIDPVLLSALSYFKTDRVTLDASSVLASHYTLQKSNGLHLLQYRRLIFPVSTTLLIYDTRQRQWLWQLSEDNIHGFCKDNHSVQNARVKSFSIMIKDRAEEFIASWMQTHPTSPDGVPPFASTAGSMPRISGPIVRLTDTTYELIDNRIRKTVTRVERSPQVVVGSFIAMLFRALRQDYVNFADLEPDFPVSVASRWRAATLHVLVCRRMPPRDHYVWGQYYSAHKVTTIKNGAWERRRPVDWW
jgi:hypothetical protein